MFTSWRSGLAWRRAALPTVLVVAVLGAAAGARRTQADDPPGAGLIDFERQIRPLIAARCFPCHSAEEKKGGLSLVDRESLVRGGKGGAAIDREQVDESLLLEKVSGADPASIMPPKGKGEPLTESEVALLRGWIEQGAKWTGGPITVEAAVRAAAANHWAFRAPERALIPRVAHSGWVRNPIDAFVLERLERAGLEPAPEADRPTLIRRLALDLLGLPPTPDEVAAFSSDPRPDAYERLVDRLLTSPRYGERWGRRWLDLARYADTNGYEKDRERPIWPYRNWVIDALNADMPFDRFTIEQVAGDLLPGATAAQRIATGYHRNTMTNEEGGIDVEEFRFAALVDRMANTGTVWLGLTLNCAQCHNHKYDPISQPEYYRLMTMLDNADEPELAVPDPERDARRRELEAEIARREAALPARFPVVDPDAEWQVLKPLRATADARDVALDIAADGSIRAGGENPERADYTIDLALPRAVLTGLRIVALTDPESPSGGPGRTPHGNLVVTGISAKAWSGDDPEPVPLAFAAASADFAQTDFAPGGVLDRDDRTGWAIDDGARPLARDRKLTLDLARPLVLGQVEGGHIRLVLEQRYGGRHTLGRLRILGRVSPDASERGAGTEAERRASHLARKQATWEASIAPVRWWIVRPERMLSRQGATLDLLPDSSVLASGDKPNTDVTEFELTIPSQVGPVTAVRLETLTHESHPEGGPGRAPLNSVGDFILTEVEASVVRDGAPPRPVRFREASSDFSEPGKPASLAIDGHPDTGWTIKGAVGKPHQAVFALAEPLALEPGARLKLVFHQFGIHQMTIGRFRLSVTAQGGSVHAAGVPAEVEDALLTPAGERTTGQIETVSRQFAAVAPELAATRQEIAELRKLLPKPVETLVMEERRPEHRRVTRVHERGEFLKAGAAVEPGVPGVLHPLPESGSPDRLALARWLVDDRNPLVARVVANRDWQAIFGRGLVSTVEDFGTRGERPTHPELLDWLALEFQQSGWSRKALHRAVVTSATYRQSSAVRPELLERDPKNELLARGPRFRVEAETVRDLALAAAGLLDQRIGGPSVYPPQPEAVTALAYSGGGWPTSTGPDRFRRGLYTYQKRTAPFAAGITFDGPTSDTTCARRDRSNTPLQALTLLNDAVFVEAARGLAARVLRESPADDAARVDRLVRLCLGRTPDAHEAETLRRFVHEQTARLERGDLDANDLAAGLAAGPEAKQLAAWTAVARVVLNLDETVTKE